MNLIEKAKEYAIACHDNVNHKYNGLRYGAHLEMVAHIASLWKDLIPKSDYETVIAACWAHDVIEDTRETYNDVKQVLGVEVAEIVYALTNEKGKNRAERANDKYYEGIRNTPLAIFVKICDRIANATYSRKTNPKMFELYRKEHLDFTAKLYVEGYREMFLYMTDLFSPDHAE